jgi:hypothetical protein
MISPARITAKSFGTLMVSSPRSFRSNARFGVSSEYADGPPTWAFKFRHAFHDEFAARLLAHHVSSNDSFTGEQVEIAISSALHAGHRWNKLAPRGTPGYDLILTRPREKWSIKSTGALTSREDKAEITKFSEFTPARWSVSSAGVYVRDKLKDIDRVFQLRCVQPARQKSDRSSPKARSFSYELLEINPRLVAEIANTLVRLRSMKFNRSVPVGSDYALDLVLIPRDRTQKASLRSGGVETLLPFQGFTAWLRENGGQRMLRLTFRGSTECRLELTGIDPTDTRICWCHANWAGRVRRE